MEHDHEPGVPGPLSLEDTGRSPDTLYCYRVVASNVKGSSTSQPACAWTKDGRDRLVYRAQLRITTGSVASAGTSNAVFATIGGAGVDTRAGSTWLDLPGADFQAGATRDYDLLGLGGITQLGDIHSIVLTKAGADNWCVERVALIIDNRPAASSTSVHPASGSA